MGKFSTPVFIFVKKHTPFSNQSTTSSTYVLEKITSYHPNISSKTDKNVDEKAEQNDQRIKEKLKRYQDQIQHMQIRKIDIGTRVFAK